MAGGVLVVLLAGIFIGVILRNQTHREQPR
jgi:hypothetical protein